MQFFSSKQVLENANFMFENLITAYVDDDDIRTIVDTIQSNVQNLVQNFFK